MKVPTFPVDGVQRLQNPDVFTQGLQQTKNRLEVSLPSLSVYLCARHTRAHLSDQQGTGLFNLRFSFCYFFKTNIFIFSAVILCTVPFLLPPLASLMAAVVGRQKEFILSRVLSIFGGSFIISFFPQRRIYVCKKQKLLFVGILHRFMSNIPSFSFGLLS